MDTRLDIEEPKTTALQTLTATHTTDIALNTANILTKQDLIQDDYLTIAKTLNLQSSLDTLQTNIDLKQDTISNFEIDGSVNLDTTGGDFDTLVIRRVNGITGHSDFIIHLAEVQIWADYKNILFENSSKLISSVVSWSDKEVDIGFQSNAPPSNLYDDNRDDSTSKLLSPVGSPSDVAVIIKNIPFTKIKDIHAIQIYNNINASRGDRTIGLTIELYNSKNDPNFNTILAHSSEFISRWSVYRIDFPSPYNLPFSGSTILPNTGLYVNLVYLEDATLISFPFNILGNVDIVGDLTASSAIVNGLNINTTLADILSRLDALENP